jgi:Cu2+-exporting ATPase
MTTAMLAPAESAAQTRGCPTTQEPPALQTAAADPAAFVRSAASGALEIDLLVRGARCAGCMRKIEGAVAALPGMREARLNLSTGRFHAVWDAGRTAPRAIVQTITDLGYAAAPFDPVDAREEEDREGKRLLACLVVAAFASMNVMMFSIPLWAGAGQELEPATRTMFHWISAAIALPAGAYAGRPFFFSAWAALRKGKANMDVPISLGVLLAAGVSVSETLLDGAHVYYEAVVTLLFLLLIGRYLDYRLRQKARAAARDLLALQAVTAARLLPSGETVSVPTRELLPGDRIIVLPGDRIPVDSLVEEGASEADISLLTGETAPEALAPGARVRAGAVNLSGRMVLRATAASDDSFLAEIARLVEAGEQSKSEYVRLADKAAALYVPLVHGAAFLTLVGWLLAGADARIAILNAAAVLIITCPCALGLAVPAVQVVATGRLFRQGVLVKSGDALERLARVDHVAFDKTGVLTEGRPNLRDPEAIDPHTLQAAGALARASRHPLARVIALAAGPGPAAPDARETPGFGVEATLEGKRARLGRASWAGVGEAASEETELWFAVDGEAPVRFSFTDALRADAALTVQALSARGLSAETLSGDRAAAVRAASAAAGIAQARGELSPADKVAALKARAAEGRSVLMVGDGLNDAPALAAASVSMAPGAAADASQSAADLVFQGEKLSVVAEAVDVARLARKRVEENFWFSALYNVVATPIAMAGLVTPLIAAVAMSASSIVVMLNAMRLMKKGAA